MIVVYWLTCSAMSVCSNNNLIYSLDALYYLDNEFRHRVVEQLKEESIAHIAELFSIVRSIDYKNLKRNNKKSKEKLNILVQHFINSGLDSLLNFPQVYVSVIDIIIMNTINVDMKEFMNYRFEANNSFYFYSVPKVLLKIVEKSIENKDVFLILLILRLHCVFKCFFF